MTSKFRKKVFFVLLVGMTFIAYRYIIKPANVRVAEQQKRVFEKQQKLSELEKATVAADDLNSQLDQLSEALNFFESRLPDKSEIHKVLEQVTVTAREQGLKPKTIRALPAKENNSCIEQPLKMELEGSFDSFYSFLLEIEKLPRIMKMRHLDLTKAEPEGHIKIDTIVSIFFQSG